MYSVIQLDLDLHIYLLFFFFSLVCHFSVHHSSWQVKYSFVHYIIRYAYLHSIAWPFNLQVFFISVRKLFIKRLKNLLFSNCVDMVPLFSLKAILKNTLENTKKSVMQLFWVSFLNIWNKFHFYMILQNHKRAKNRWLIPDTIVGKMIGHLCDITKEEQRCSFGNEWKQKQLGIQKLMLVNPCRITVKGCIELCWMWMWRMSTCLSGLWALCRRMSGKEKVFFIDLGNLWPCLEQVEASIILAVRSGQYPRVSQQTAAWVPLPLDRT